MNLASLLRRCRRWWPIGFLLVTSAVSGHEASIAQVRIDAADVKVEVELDVVDLDFVLGIRSDGSARLSVADVRRSTPEIERYVIDNIAIEGCTLVPHRGNPGIRTGFNPRIVASFDLQCTGSKDSRVVSSRLFSELPDYRTVVTVLSEDSAQNYPLRDGATTVALRVADRGGAFLGFVGEGYRHIFEGLDHLLFLLLLVLPTVRSTSLRGSVILVAGIVSAFTIAHSVTLALSTFGYVSLPANLVEPVIAASIVVAAMLNIVARAERMLWPIAYLFGLIHGFGFAGGFAELAAGSPIRWTDLLGFNLGVEIGQLTVTIIAVVMLHIASRSVLAERLLVPVGSLVVGAVGAAWFAERVF